MRSVSLLVVDDDHHVAASTADWLRTLGYKVETARRAEEAIRRLEQQRFAAVLADIRLAPGEADGFAIVAAAKRLARPVPVILFTGYSDFQTVAAAVRAGASDILQKPLLDDELESALARVLKRERVVQKQAQLRGELDSPLAWQDIVGRDLRMQEIYDLIDRVAESRATVLITGESGTGKSLIARAIHERSARATRPFIEVACGALPDTLLESELFGHQAGSFTGASETRLGRFRQADGGTIFLDEIGTATPALQVKLLRVLQEMQFEAVGGSETHAVDVRAILATNEDLAARVREGKFRQDLYYRINVVTLELPPLRERRGDIRPLAEHFLTKYAHQSGRLVHSISAGALEALEQHAWPGNVRELENVIERAIVLGRGEQIERGDLPAPLRGSTATGAAGSRAAAKANTLKEALELPERRLILDTLAKHDGNRLQTALALGINRTTLYKKMKRLGMESEV